MPIKLQDWYTREEIQANPETLYVFGDNAKRVGLRGQAAEARDEPNAVGLVTKWHPGGYEACFLTDADLLKVIHLNESAKVRLISHLLKGGTVVWPKYGVGTGFAKLPQRAPLVARYYDGLLRDMQSVAPAKENAKAVA